MKPTKISCFFTLLKLLLVCCALPACQVTHSPTLLGKRATIENAELMPIAGHLGMFAQARGAKVNIKYTKDGEYLLSSFGDNIVKKWHVQTGRLVNSIHIDANDLKVLAFSPTGKLVASAHEDGTLRLWDINTGTEYKSLLAYSGYPYYLAFSESGKLLIVRFAGYIVNIWHIASGSLLSSFEVKKPIINTKFSNDEKTFVVGLRNGNIEKWDIDSGKRLESHRIKPINNKEQSNTSFISFSPHGNNIIAKLNNGDSYLLISKNKPSTITVCKRCYGINSHIFSNNGVLHIMDYSKTTAYEEEVLSTLGGKIKFKIHKFNGDIDKNLHSAFLSPNAQTYVAAYEDGSLELWSTTQQKRLHTFEGQGAVFWADFSNQNTMAVVLGEDYAPKVMDTFTGKVTHVLHGHGSAVQSFRFSDTGKRAISSSEKPIAILWDWEKGRRVNHYGDGEDCIPDSANTLSDEEFLEMIEAEDLESKEPCISISYSAALSPDGHLVAANSMSNGLYMWNSKSGRLLKKWFPKSGSSYAGRKVAFSPDSDQLVSAYKNGLVMVWDKKTNSVTSPLGRVSTSTFDMAYSPDGKYIAFGSNIGETTIYSLADWTKVLTISGYVERVSSLRFTNDGKYVITGHADGLVKIINVGTGKTKQLINAQAPIIRGKIGYFPEKNLMIVPTFDALRYLNLDTGELLAKVFITHRGEWAVTTPAQCFEKSAGFRLYWKDGSRLHPVEDVNTDYRIRNLLEGLLKNRKPSSLFFD